MDDRLRRADRHAPTVGILLCTSRNEQVVRYALSASTAPRAVAGYTYDTLPADEQAALPTAAELAAALELAGDGGSCRTRRNGHGGGAPGTST